MNNTTIKLFVGDPIRVSSEQELISRLRIDLERLGVPATLYANFFPVARTSSQVDLLVCTAHRTAHVEIKGLSSDYPVRARPNGLWAQLMPDGAERPLDQNCGRQALNGTYGISDAMRDMARQEAWVEPQGGFKRCIDTIVGMWHTIPDGSEIAAPRFVSVLGYNDLLGILVQPGPMVPWAEDQWETFARKHNLYQIGIESESERQRRASLDLITDYRLRAGPILAAGLNRYIDIGVIDDQGRKASSSDISNRLSDGEVLAVVAPSGHGKSLFARDLAARHCGHGHLVAWLRADEYETGRFSGLLARSMAPFSAERWGVILRAAKKHGVPTTLIVDGLNECPESERGRLLEQLKACVLRYPSSVLITTTKEEHISGWLEATVLRMNKPDESARLGILISHGAEHPERIGDQFRTPYELSIAARLDRDLGESASIADLEGAYIREVAPTEQIRKGLRSLATRLHSELRTSMGLNEAHSLLNSPTLGLTPRQVDEVLNSQLLDMDRQRLRFHHDLTGQFLVAEDIVRSATSSHSLGSTLSAPANAELAEKALNIEGDPQRVWEALKVLESPELVCSALTAAYGVDVAEMASQAIQDTLQKGIAATETASFKSNTGPLGDGRWITDHGWSRWERGLLTAAGQGFARGMFFDDICELIDRTDEICLAQTRRLKAAGDPIPVSRIVEGTYTQRAASADGHGLAMSYIARAFEVTVMRGVFAGTDDYATSIQSMRAHFASEWERNRIASRLVAGAGDLSWGRYYFALLGIDPNDPSEEAIFARLLRRAWDSNASNVRLQALYASQWFVAASEPHRSEIATVLEALESNNWALQSTIVEALAWFGRIKNPTTAEETISDIRRMISHPDDTEQCELARKAVSSQFEPQEIVGPYAAAIESLTRLEKVRLYTMAVRGSDPSGSPHIAITLSELADLLPTGDATLDKAAKSVILPFLDGPPERSFTPSDAVDACLAAIRGWAKFESILSPETNALEPRQRNWRIVASLPLGYEHNNGPNDAEGIWHTLLNQPRETIATIANLDSASPSAMEDFQQPIRRPLRDLAEEYQEPLRRLFEWAINNPSDMPVEVSRTRPNFVMRMLAVVGDASTAAKLRLYTLDPESGEAAVEAIRQINRHLAP